MFNCLLKKIDGRNHFRFVNNYFVDITCKQFHDERSRCDALIFIISIAEHELHMLYHCATLSSLVKKAFASSKTNYSVPCFVCIASMNAELFMMLTFKIIMNIQVSLMVTEKLKSVSWFFYQLWGDCSWQFRKISWPL